MNHTDHLPIVRQTIGLLLLVWLVLALCGCASYSHTAANGDRTTFRSFLVWGEAAKVSSDTLAEGSNYTRNVKIGSLKGGTETEKLNQLIESISAGVSRGLAPGK